MRSPALPRADRRRFATPPAPHRLDVGTAWDIRFSAWGPGTIVALDASTTRLQVPLSARRRVVPFPGLSGDLATRFPGDSASQRPSRVTTRRLSEPTTCLRIAMGIGRHAYGATGPQGDDATGRHGVGGSRRYVARSSRGCIVENLRRRVVESTGGRVGLSPKGYGAVAFAGIWRHSSDRPSSPRRRVVAVACRFGDMVPRGCVESAIGRLGAEGVNPPGPSSPRRRGALTIWGRGEPETWGHGAPAIRR
jgi:hypothetical protein